MLLLLASGRPFPHKPLVSASRSVSGPLHFYQNRQLELYASKKATPLTLRQLVFFGKSMNEERLIKSANYVRQELPIRIAHRLRDMQALPYVVVTREGVAKIYELYWSAFEKLRRYPHINSLDDNSAFCTFLKGLLDEHLPVIPNLYLGLSLASHHLQPEQLDSFMRRMLVSRISRRVLAEHHLELSASSSIQFSRSSHTNPDNIGIIYTNLGVKSRIQHCIELLKLSPHHVIDLDNDFIRHGGNPTDDWPEIIIDGHEDTHFSYIKEHLDYIVFELLKNALRFTILRHQSQDKRQARPIIRATIVAGPDDVSIRISDQGGGLLMNTHVQTAADLFSFSHVRNAGRLEDERLGALRDAASRGIKGTVGEQVMDNILDSASMEVRERLATRGVPPRIGIGLPMSNIYARYFGGSLQLMTLDGWGVSFLSKAKRLYGAYNMMMQGTDVYVRLPKLGTNLEGIEV